LLSGIGQIFEMMKKDRRLENLTIVLRQIVHRRPPLLRIEDAYGFDTLAVCHVLIHPIALDDLPIRDIIAKMRHDGCGGRAGKAELLTGIEGVSGRPVRKIVLRDG
jgi:hypothetical protein